MQRLATLRNNKNYKWLSRPTKLTPLAYKQSDNHTGDKKPRYTIMKKGRGRVQSGVAAGQQNNDTGAINSETCKGRRKDIKIKNLDMRGIPPHPLLLKRKSPALLGFFCI